MSRSISPGSSHSSDGGRPGWRSSALVELVRNHGLKALVAILVAALFAFAPLTLLYWFNELRVQSVVSAQVGYPVVVKPERHKDEQEEEEPGETALLQVICEIPSYDGVRELLCDNDPVRRDLQTSDSLFVRRERIYLRPAGYSLVPYGLLGKPPISAWLPAGEYEILVVHEAPTVDLTKAEPVHGFPLVSVFAQCTLESKQKTVCRIPLPHYDGEKGTPIPLTGIADTAADGKPTASELRLLVEACEQVQPIPTPAGYLLSLDEPSVQHEEDHRDCRADLNVTQAIPREWTRDQLVTVRNWLPADAHSARSKLTELIDSLQWREYLEGWFCYAAAGVAGLVFTRWGAIALVEPWRRRQAWSESLGLMVKIFLAGGALLFLFQVLANWQR